MKKELKNTAKIIAFPCICILCNQQIKAQHSGTDYGTGITVNFIRTWEATAPETSPNALMSRPLKDVKQATQYFDGLGRLLQTVAKQGSLATGSAATDMVNPIEYDQYGREQYKYLPFAANNTGGNTSIADGAFKLNPFAQQVSFMNSTYGTQGETYFYSKTNFEASPLNRPTDIYAPGNSWAGSELNPPAQQRNVQMKYFINTVTDDVKIWNVTDVTNNLGSYAVSTVNNGAGAGVYPAGELYKNITVDENKKQVIEFKDKEGKVILKKVQISTMAGTEDDGSGRGYPGWLCTYYIYDDLSRLRCVIQPEAVKLMSSSPQNWNVTPYLNEQCFRYEYDAKNRMIMKKVPGAGEVYKVYDGRDRLIMTQDANMRNCSPSKWMITKYDALNRPCETGLWNNDGNNFATHLANAYSNTTGYPTNNVNGYEELTKTFYNDYNWLSANNNPFPSSNYNVAYNTYFQTASNSNWPYAQNNVQSFALNGMITGSKVKVLGTSAYLYSMILYDEKGRTIQVFNKNNTGGTDITTTQYNWPGQPLVMVQKQEKATSPNAQTTIIVSQFTYDDLGRVVKTEKKVSNTLVNGNAMPAYKTIAQNEYDKLGQLKIKKLAPSFNNNAGLETLTYDYNIRGWLLGTNRDYLTATGQSGTSRFGFELGYDKTTNKTGHNFLGTGMFNGNITGMVWKTDADDVRRKYDFSYDAANRLLKGDFEQDDASNSWNATTMNYKTQMGDGSDPASAYDANGNIKAMTQYGWKLGGSANTAIDQLTYSYFANSNKLQSVADAITIDNKLGDFTDKNTTPSDYGYDRNGNMVTDLNKRINGTTGTDLATGGAITYNYLNLPQSIDVKNDDNSQKGTITYTYDASGNKLKKVAVENPSTANANKTITSTTNYIAGFVYESKTTLPANTPNDDYTDKLLFIPHEEGRIRLKPAIDSIAANFAYDYFIKDHLGNVRMVLTDEAQTDLYPAATMEDAQATTEEIFYGNLPQTRIGLPPGYPPNSPTGNQRVAKVTGTTWGGMKIGPAIALKVMAGDKFNVQVNSWYKLAKGQTIPAPSGIITELLAALNNAVGGISGSKATPTDLNSTGILLPGVNNFLTNQGNGSSNTAPRAYINWILFDEQFNYVSSNSGFEQVPEESYFNNDNIPNNNTKLHVFNDLPISKSGFLYIYVSNETPNIDLFFDNLQVTHIRGQILETNEFYAGGLKMAGISYKSAGSFVNKNLFLGNELQNGEFSDGSGLELYDMEARNFDQQTMRFTGIDILSDKVPRWSPYNYSFDNPIRFSDGTGMAPDDWIKNTKTKKYEWRSEVTTASNIPEGYSYVGKQDNDIVKDLGYSTVAQTKATNVKGIIHADVQEGDPKLYIADYSASHPVSIDVNTSVSVSANVSSTWDNHGIITSKEFKGINIDIATKVTSSSEEKLMATANVSTRITDNFQLGENKYAPGTAVVSQVGSTYLTGSITFTAEQAMQKPSIPVINISGTFWRQDGSYSIPVYPIPILSGQLNPISPLEYSQIIVPPLKR